MVQRIEELGAPVGVMDEADRMPMVRMRVPVQTPAPSDVAVVRSPEDADGGEDAQEDPGVEDTGVEPVSGAAGVQPFQGEDPREHEHQPTGPSLTCTSGFRRGAERLATVITTPQRSTRGTRARVGEARDRLRIPRTPGPASGNVT